MLADPLMALRALRARLGREPSFVEMLRELGHDPAGVPVAAVTDPGYPQQPGLASQLLGPVESDAGLSAMLEEQSLLESNPDLVRLRDELVRRLLFGIEEETGGPPRRAGSLFGLGGPGGGGGPPIPVKNIGSRPGLAGGPLAP